MLFFTKYPLKQAFFVLLSTKKVKIVPIADVLLSHSNSTYFAKSVLLTCPSQYTAIRNLVYCPSRKAY